MRKSGARKTASKLLLVNIFVAAAGVVSTSTIAWCFGTSAEAAVFFGAWSLCSIFNRLFQSGQLAELAVPAYHRDLTEFGASEAARRFAVITNIGLIFTGSIGFLLWLGADPLTRLLLPGFSKDQLALASWAFRWLLPVLPLMVLGSLLQALGNAQSLFARFELWLVAGSLVGSALVFAGHAKWGIGALIASSWVVQLVAIFGRLLQLSRGGYRHHWALSIPGFSPWRLVRELGFTGVYVAATQFYLLALNAALTTLPSQLYVAFKYGDQLFARSSSLIMRPVSAVFYTQISGRLAQKAGGTLRLARRALEHFVDLWALYATILIVTAPHLISAVWGGPRFGQDEVAVAAVIFTSQAAASLFRAHGIIFRKQNIARGAVRRQYLGNVIAQLACALIAAPLVLSNGILGATVVLVLNMVFLAVSDAFVSAHVGTRPILQVPWRRILLWTAAGIASSWAAQALIPDFIGDSTGSRFLQLAMAMAKASASVVIILTLGFFAGFGSPLKILRG
jgi:peptidoglycan biosynthesis protein MviN/MurJ (putative lipid II flippase)